MHSPYSRHTACFLASGVWQVSILFLLLFMTGAEFIWCVKKKVSGKVPRQATRVLPPFSFLVGPTAWTKRATNTTRRIPAILYCSSLADHSWTELDFCLQKWFWLGLQIRIASYIHRHEHCYGYTVIREIFELKIFHKINFRVTNFS